MEDGASQGRPLLPTFIITILLHVNSDQETALLQTVQGLLTHSLILLSLPPSPNAQLLPTGQFDHQRRKINQVSEQMYAPFLDGKNEEFNEDNWGNLS